MSSYQELEDHFRGIADLNHARAILGWDEAAMMPPGGGEARASALAAIDVLVHQRQTDPRLTDLLSAADEESGLDDWQRANLRELRREVELATCLPEAFVAAQSKACARSEQAWRYLRADNDWQGMRPLLEEVVRLAREEAGIQIGRAHV